jgi:hypothetical protein
MKKFASLALIALATLWLAPSNLVAQNQQFETQTLTGLATYQIVDGDTVWGLTPDGWQRIEADPANSFLAGRRFTLNNGGPGLLIYPRETLTIPEGVTITFRRPVQTNPQPAAQPAPIVVAPANPGITAADLDSLWWWIVPMLLLVLAALALLGWWLSRLQRNRENELNTAATRRHEEITRRLNQIDENATRNATAINTQLGELRTSMSAAVGTMRLGLHVVGHTHEGRREGEAQTVTEAIGEETDFVQVHKRVTGETLGFLVNHGTAIIPMADGAAINGRAVALTEAARNRERRDMAERETEEVPQAPAAAV